MTILLCVALASPAAAEGIIRIGPEGIDEIGLDPVDGAVGLAAVPGTDDGVLVVTDEGHLVSGPGAPEVASRDPLDEGYVAMAATQTAVWTVTSSGKVSGPDNFGDLAGVPLAAPVVGIAATPAGDGYWLAAADGGVFTYGTASFHGSVAGITLNAPVVGIAATPAGDGYWLVAADGGVFSFGGARFAGSMADRELRAPIVGMAATGSGDGYWLVAADGGVFSFGDAPFFGSVADRELPGPVVGVSARSRGEGLLLVVDGGDPLQRFYEEYVASLSPERRDIWQRLAWCESSNRWDINTGNGYYGGLQFLPSSWYWVGGVGLPHLASREEQIYRAELLWRLQGWGAWPTCARRLGLPVGIPG